MKDIMKAVGERAFPRLSMPLSPIWPSFVPKARKRRASGFKLSTRAEEFGFNIFCQGWRLRRTGYDYGPGDNDPRFYAIIPMRGQYTATKKAAWRVYTTGNGSMTVDDGFDFGNGCGAAIRCVKNYKK